MCNCFWISSAIVPEGRVNPENVCKVRIKCLKYKEIAYFFFDFTRFFCFFHKGHLSKSLPMRICADNSPMP